LNFDSHGSFTVRAFTMLGCAEWPAGRRLMANRSEDEHAGQGPGADLTDLADLLNFCQLCAADL